MDRLEPVVEVEKKTTEIAKEEVSKEEKKQEIPAEKKIVLKKETIEKQSFSVNILSTPEKEMVKEETNQEEMAENEIEQEEQFVNSYVSNFENLTISDVKKEIEEKKQQEEKELEEKQIETEEENISQEEIVENEIEQEEQLDEPIENPVKKLVIERPNYDFITESKTKKKEKKKEKPKFKAVAMACALAVASIGCVAGTIVVDNLQSSYIELQDEYNLNLFNYLRNINNLNATNSSMDFLETYPEDLNDPSSVGETTNWFDSLANFIAGIFGG